MEQTAHHAYTKGKPRRIKKPNTVHCVLWCNELVCYSKPVSGHGNSGTQAEQQHVLQGDSCRTRWSAGITVAFNVHWPDRWQVTPRTLYPAPAGGPCSS